MRAYHTLRRTLVAVFSHCLRCCASERRIFLIDTRHKIPGIWDIDTRALVRHIRKVGVLRGIVSTDGTAADQLLHEAKSLPTMAGQELASRGRCARSYDWTKGPTYLLTSPRAEQRRESPQITDAE